MSYASLEMEWDETWTGCLNPLAVGDKVLCCALEVMAGEIVEVRLGNTIDKNFYTIRLEDGSVDVFAAEDVMKRKLEDVAA